MVIADKARLQTLVGLPYIKLRFTESSDAGLIVTYNLDREPHQRNEPLFIERKHYGSFAILLGMNGYNMQTKLEEDVYDFLFVSEEAQARLIEEYKRDHEG